MVEWVDDPQLWPHLLIFILRFLSTYSCLLALLLISISIHLNKQPSSLSRLVTFHHLSNWSLCYCTSAFASDLNALQPCGGFAAIRQILLFIKVALVFPAGNCPTHQRTPLPCWAHLRKEPSTWRGPSLLMATVPSYVTFWRFQRIVSHVSCVSRTSFVISFRKGGWCSGINVTAKKT